MSQPAGSLPARVPPPFRSLSLRPLPSLPCIPSAGHPSRAALSSARSSGLRRRCFSCPSRPGARRRAPRAQGCKRRLGAGQANTRAGKGCAAAPRHPRTATGSPGAPARLTRLVATWKSSQILSFCLKSGSGINPSCISRATREAGKLNWCDLGWQHRDWCVLVEGKQGSLFPHRWGILIAAEMRSFVLVIALPSPEPASDPD